MPLVESEFVGVPSLRLIKALLVLDPLALSRPVTGPVLLHRVPFFPLIASVAVGGAIPAGRLLLDALRSINMINIPRQRIGSDYHSLHLLEVLRFMVQRCEDQLKVIDEHFSVILLEEATASLCLVSKSPEIGSAEFTRNLATVACGIFSAIVIVDEDVIDAPVFVDHLCDVIEDVRHSVLFSFRSFHECFS